MTDDIKLPPLPSGNVAHLIAAQAAEIEALRAEVERLREALKDADNELDWLDEEMDTCDHSVGVCMCSYWSMRRKMKAALAKENSND
jgi:chromosome segregation ATPase